MSKPYDKSKRGYFHEKAYYAHVCELPRGEMLAEFRDVLGKLMLADIHIQEKKNG